MHFWLSFSWGNNQQEPLDYNNKVSDFNSRSDPRNNRSSEPPSDYNTTSENKKSEFYYYKNPDNSVERVELRQKISSGLFPDRRVEELRDTRQSSHSPTPERRSRLSSPLLQRRQPGYNSPGQQRKSLEVRVANGLVPK